jgi:DNA-binding LytR/AlgR family response regulator
MKLYVNSRDELRILNLDKTVYLKASNNYTDFHFSDGQVRSYVSCLSAFERQITDVYQGLSPFVRTGRSYLVNVNYIAAINLQRQMIKFTTDEVLQLPKTHLKWLKEYILVNCRSLENPMPSDNKS